MIPWRNTILFLSLLTLSHASAALHTHECVMWVRHCTHMDGSCVYVTAHTWMDHDPFKEHNFPSLSLSYGSCEWATAHTRMCHVNESQHTHEWVMTPSINTFPPSLSFDESCEWAQHTHEWVMWVHNGTYMNRSCLLQKTREHFLSLSLSYAWCEWVMTHTWMGHVSFRKREKHISSLSLLAMSHVRESRNAHEWVMWVNQSTHTNGSCFLQETREKQERNERKKRDKDRNVVPSTKTHSHDLFMCMPWLTHLTHMQERVREKTRYSFSRQEYRVSNEKTTRFSCLNERKKREKDSNVVSFRLAGKKFGHPAGMQKINGGLKRAAVGGSRRWHLQMWW